MGRFLKLLVVTLMGLSLFWLWGLAQRSQTINVNVEAALMMACRPASFGPINVGLGNGNPTPYHLGSWSCNIDALTTYMLNSSLALRNPPSGVSASSFLQNCISDEHEQGAICLATAPVRFGPTITLAKGKNSAGTDGHDYSGDVFVTVAGWNGSMSNGISGVIVYQVFDASP